MCNVTTLEHLPIDRTGIIKCFKCCGAELRHLQDMGLCCGVSIKAVQNSPSGDPRAYCFRGVVIALRDDDADKIVVSVCK